MKLVPVIYKILGRSESPKKDKSAKREKLHKTESAESKIRYDADRKVRPVASPGRGNENGPEQNTGIHEGAAEHFEDLAQAVSAVNYDLQGRGADYRFSIYKENGEVFISLVQADDTGHIVRLRKKNITHQEFYEWIKHIEKGEGFFVDAVR